MAWSIHPRVTPAPRRRGRRVSVHTGSHPLAPKDATVANHENRRGGDAPSCCLCAPYGRWESPVRVMAHGVRGTPRNGRLGRRPLCMANMGHSVECLTPRRSQRRSALPRKRSPGYGKVMRRPEGHARGRMASYPLLSSQGTTPRGVAAQRLRLTVGPGGPMYLPCTLPASTADLASRTGGRCPLR